MSFDQSEFKRHQRAIDQKREDALAFIKIGAQADAKRLVVEISCMGFGDLPARDQHKLLRHAGEATRAIGVAICEGGQ